MGVCRFFSYSYSYSLLLNYLLQKVVLAKVQHRFNISYTAVSHSAFCTPCGGPASSLFPMALCHSATSAISLFPIVLRNGASRSASIHRSSAQKQLRSGVPASCVFLMVLLPASPPRRPSQQHLPDSSLPQCRHPLRHSAPASNKPHSAEKSTPVWLAIWRTWAGFANSQQRDAALATPDNICAHSSLLPH